MQCFYLKRGFLYSPIPSLTGMENTELIFLSIRCFCLKEGFFFQPYFISAHLWYHTMFLLEEGVFIQPCSISYGITLWLKKNEQLYYFILHVIGYFSLFLSLLYWLSLGFSMASSRGSCRESCPSFLNSYKSPAQGLAMLKSRHIPSI